MAKKKVPANLRLDRDNFGQNCPKGIRTRAYKKIATYNVHPEGVHIWVPFRAPIIMHTRRVCIWAPKFQNRRSELRALTRQAPRPSGTWNEAVSRQTQGWLGPVRGSERRLLQPPASQRTARMARVLQFTQERVEGRAGGEDGTSELAEVLPPHSCKNEGGGGEQYAAGNEPGPVVGDVGSVSVHAAAGPQHCARALGPEGR